MISKMLKREGVEVRINCMNQLEVDMSVDQMNALYLQHRGRMPRARVEVEDFINMFVHQKIVQSGLLKK